MVYVASFQSVAEIADLGCNDRGKITTKDTKETKAAEAKKPKDDLLPSPHFDLEPVPIDLDWEWGELKGGKCLFLSLRSSPWFAGEGAQRPGKLHFEELIPLHVRL